MMIRKLTFASIAAVVLTGCGPKMTVEDMKAMIQQRPAELDKLNAFAGKWEFTGESKMGGLDEVLKISGTSEANWEGNNWYLVSRATFNMGDLGEMQGIETWTYDTHTKKYRSTWTDSTGSMGAGMSTYNEKTNTWHMRATSHGPFGKTTGRGQVKLIDANTMEWSWNEYALGGLIKTGEMTGTSRRR